MYIGLVEVLRLQLSSYRSYKRPANATAGVLRKKDKLHGKERKTSWHMWCLVLEKNTHVFFLGGFWLKEKNVKT